MLYFKKYVILPSVRFFALEFPKTRRKGNWKMAEFSTSEHELVLVIDFGGQYNQLIATHVCENIACTARSSHTRHLSSRSKAKNPIGHHLHGRSQTAYILTSSPRIDKRNIRTRHTRYLGICYGCQLMAHVLGGKVSTCITSEYGKTETELTSPAYFSAALTVCPKRLFHG